MILRCEFYSYYVRSRTEDYTVMMNRLHAVPTPGRLSSVKSQYAGTSYTNDEMNQQNRIEVRENHIFLFRWLQHFYVCTNKLKSFGAMPYMVCKLTLNEGNIRQFIQG
jgi:hypothetical protein